MKSLDNAFDEVPKVIPPSMIDEDKVSDIPKFYDFLNPQSVDFWKKLLDEEVIF